MGRTTKREKPVFAKNATLRTKAAGWNWHDLARHARISHSTVRDILSGISPGLEENREAIAQALGCSMADLYRSDQAPIISQKIVDMTSDELVEKIARASKNHDLEIARLRKENSELVAKINSLPPEFWPVWQKKAGPRVRAIFLYLLLGGKYLDQVEIPESLRKVLKMVRGDLAPS